jgi:hypothetical protein
VQALVLREVACEAVHRTNAVNARANCLTPVLRGCCPPLFEPEPS